MAPRSLLGFLIQGSQDAQKRQYRLDLMSTHPDGVEIASVAEHK